MQAGKELLLKLPHITLAAQQWGDSDKPIIIATHGWLDNSNSFQPIADYLQDYCIIAVDFPGHGQSEHRQTGYPLHLTDYVLDLELVINEIKVQYNLNTVNLLSHSFGGIISVLYASVFPENISKLILLDILMPIFEPEVNAKKRLKQSVAAHKLALSSSVSSKLYSSVDSVAKVREKVTDLNFENSKLIVSRNLKEKEGGYQWTTDPKLKLMSSWRFSLQQVMSLIDFIETPVLGIYSKQSRALAQVDSFKSRFAALKVETVEGGHHIHMDNPKTCSLLVNAFIT